MIKDIFLGDLENRITIKQALFIREIERKFFAGEKVSIELRKIRKEILKKVIDNKF
jgi:hypothetical protein